LQGINFCFPFLLLWSARGFKGCTRISITKLLSSQFFYIPQNLSLPGIIANCSLGSCVPYVFPHQTTVCTIPRYYCTLCTLCAEGQGKPLALEYV
jgi:hypothetical protein